MSDSERRRLPRLKTLIATEVATPSGVIRNEPNFAATCLDLSATGMVFSFRQQLKAGSVVLAMLELPRSRVHASATVLRCEPTRRAGWWKIAVKFDGLFEDDQQRIAEYVAEEREKRVD